MERTRFWQGVAVAAGFFAGCTGPDPVPPTHGQRWVEREQAAAKPAGKVPPGTMAPVDAWRVRLTDELPAPWRLGSIDAQIIAPPGWCRLDGDRGLIVWATDGKQRQDFYVLPRNWKGEVFDKSIAGHEIARNDQFFLWAPLEDAQGWNGTEVVKAALGFGEKKKKTTEVASKE